MTARSPKAPVSRASTVRTAGGRLAVGAAAAIVGVGLVFLMWWLFVLGSGRHHRGVTGLLFEYYYGDFARE